MTYLRGVAGYLTVALVASFLVIHLWAQYQLRVILETGSGVTLRQYVAPSWHRLAAQIRSGQVVLSPEQHAAKFDRVAAHFESEATSEERTAQSEVEGARLFFHISLGIFLAQIALALLLGIVSVRRQQRAGTVPPN